MSINDGRQKRHTREVNGRSDGNYESQKRRKRRTPLETFLRANKLKPSRVAREADISRQHLRRLRIGAATARITTGVALVFACSRLVGRKVTLADLFDIEKPR